MAVFREIRVGAAMAVVVAPAKVEAETTQRFCAEKGCGTDHEQQGGLQRAGDSCRLFSMSTPFPALDDLEYRVSWLRRRGLASRPPSVDALCAMAMCL